MATKKGNSMKLTDAEKVIVYRRRMKESDNEHLRHAEEQLPDLHILLLEQLFVEGALMATKKGK